MDSQAPGFSTLYLAQETHFPFCQSDPAIGLGAWGLNNSFNPRGYNRFCNAGENSTAL